jgi:Tol biopolymer transport system component
MRRFTLALLLVSCLVGLRAEGGLATNGFTTHDVHAFDDQTSWSPDGRWIAYARPRTLDPGKYDLVLAAPDGSVERSLGSAGSGTWSPDGRRILAVGGDPYHRVVDLASNESRSLSVCVDDFGGIDWSPDGERLAFVVCSLSQHPLFSARWDGSSRQLVVSDGYEPAWSPDGEDIAYSHRLYCGDEGAIEIVRSDGTHHRSVRRPGEGRGRARWSPDGTTVSFSTSPGLCTPSPDRTYLVGRDGQGERLLGETPFSTHPTWSPNGRWLALTDWSSYGGLVLMSADGIAQRSFAASSPFTSWAPDGERIAYLRGSSIFVGTTTGVERRVGTGRGPDWSPDGRRISFLDAAYDGIVFFAHCDEQVFVVDAEGGGRRPVSSCWQTGSLFPDVIRGTAANDVADAYLGNDRIYGGEGRDLLKGWGGNDRLYGGPDEDILKGGRGADRLGARDRQVDVIMCGTGRDVVLADKIDLVDPDCEVVRRRTA